MLENEKKLTIELLPETARTKTLFQSYTKTRRIIEWTEIKDELLEREGRKCFICGKKSSHLHLHEFWDFDEDGRIMKLQKLHHLCDMCQTIKRTDFWFFTDYGKEQLKHFDINFEDIIKHYCKVNNCSLEDFRENWKEAILKWRELSEIDWKQDFGNYL